MSWVGLHCSSALAKDMAGKRQEDGTPLQNEVEAEAYFDVEVLDVSGRTLYEDSVQGSETVQKFCLPWCRLLDNAYNVLRPRTTIAEAARGASCVSLTRLDNDNNAPWEELGGIWEDREYTQLVLDTMCSTSDIRHVARAWSLATTETVFGSLEDGLYFLERLEELEKICQQADTEDYALLRPFFQVLGRVFASNKVSTVATHSIQVKDFELQYNTRQIQGWKKKCFANVINNYKRVRFILGNIDHLLRAGPDCEGVLRDRRDAERRLEHLAQMQEDQRRLQEVWWDFWP